LCQILSLSGAGDGYVRYLIDTTALFETLGWSPGSELYIKFQYYDGAAQAEQGVVFDDIRVSRIAETFRTLDLSASAYAACIIKVDGEQWYTPYTHAFTHGTTVTLEPIGNSYCQFLEWQGDLSGTSTPCTVTMDNDKDIAAIFRPIAPTMVDEPAATVGESNTVTWAPAWSPYEYLAE